MISEAEGVEMASRVRWTEGETKLALYLYFQLPFGQLHFGNPEIVALASKLGRTPSSVAMKLANFASLDPKILESGRKGLQGASALDRKIWEEFHGDWTKLILEIGTQEDAQPPPTGDRVEDVHAVFRYEPLSGATTARAEVEQRIGQGFFRRAVLANFENTCCVTGIAEPQLLMASHISPWGTDVSNRHNPRNGLCLSATFDRAFDRNLMTVAPDLTVQLSSRLLQNASSNTRTFFEAYQGQKLRSPTHVIPDADLLRKHNASFLA